MHYEICACSLLDSGRTPDSRSGEQELSRISALLVTKKRQASENGGRGACRVKSLARGPGEVMYWAPGNNEILEGRGSFVNGAQPKGCQGLE